MIRLLFTAMCEEINCVHLELKYDYSLQQHLKLLLRLKSENIHKN